MPLFPFAPTVTAPEPWALGFAAPPRVPYVADVDGDGMADLVVVYPIGGAIIDLNLTREAVKSGGGFQALNPFGQNCQASAVGEFDGQRGADIVGLFDGKHLNLAHGYRDGRLTNDVDWLVLPKAVPQPVLAATEGGKRLLVFSGRSGTGYSVETATKAVTEIRAPKGTVWLGDVGTNYVIQTAKGEIVWLDSESLKRKATVGHLPATSRPAAAKDLLVIGDRAWTPFGTIELPESDLPKADAMYGAGDVDGDGDADIFEFRYGSERHTANQVLLRRVVSPGETDNDHDGLSNAEEASLGTNPNRADTDDDGLIDSWEVRGYRGLDMPKLGCDPRHADLLCLISRFEPVAEAKLKSEIARVTKFYADLPAKNPDGVNGFTFHPIYLDPVTGDDTKSGWPQNRDKFRPEKWRGVVHWMQVTPGGGGQADQLGDGGGCGEGALWAVFVHEFGHQLGLDHEGFWPNGSCPIYSSLMNYNYSYGFEDSRDKIHYSDGSLSGYVLHETDLDETIPLPYDRVKFLEKGPYHFRLKANGPTTLVDWNWNGVFGEKHIRADINYAYSTNAGRRDDVGKTRTSPWLFVHQKQAYVVFGGAETPTPTIDKTLSADQPGELRVRRLRKPFEWDKTWAVATGLTGDPVAASLGGSFMVVYPRKDGIFTSKHTPQRDGSLRSEAPQRIDENPAKVANVGQAFGRSYLLLWDPVSGETTISEVQKDGSLGKGHVLDAKSTNPPGLCEDTVRKEVVIALAQNQSEQKTNRWQVRRYRVKDAEWTPAGMEWVEGEGGQARGTGRMIALFERSRDAGPQGRIYIYCRGLTSPANPWACTYVAHQIADKTIQGGWLVKRYYDEWTQSRSAPAAAWFNGDVIWSYRWVDGGGGPTDDNLHVGYYGLGIQSEPFGDHDDIGFIRRFGARNSLLSLGNP